MFLRISPVVLHPDRVGLTVSGNDAQTTHRSSTTAPVENVEKPATNPPFLQNQERIDSVSVFIRLLNA